MRPSQTLEKRTFPSGPLSNTKRSSRCTPATETCVSVSRLPPPRARDARVRDQRGNRLVAVERARDLVARTADDELLLEMHAALRVEPGRAYHRAPRSWQNARRARIGPQTAGLLGGALRARPRSRLARTPTPLLSAPFETPPRLEMRRAEKPPKIDGRLSDDVLARRAGLPRHGDDRPGPERHADRGDGDPAALRLELPVRGRALLRSRAGEDHRDLPDARRLHAPGRRRSASSSTASARAAAATASRPTRSATATRRCSRPTARETEWDGIWYVRSQDRRARLDRGGQDPVQDDLVRPERRRSGASSSCARYGARTRSSA